MRLDQIRLGEELPNTKQKILMIPARVAKVVVPRMARFLEYVQELVACVRLLIV